MSNIFNSSLEKFDQILSKGQASVLENKQMFSKSRNYSMMSNESLVTPTKFSTEKTLIEYDKNFILDNFGTNEYSFSSISIGSHPDFTDLDHTNYLMHHCISMFVDIKGSTKLIEKYSILEVRLIKDTLLSLVVLVVNQFGGHIQRLQGDGVFISFARRSKEPKNSIVNALNAASILAQFVSIDLSNIFKKNEITPLRIRIGIDYGDDENVLWSYYGINGCDELTTTSLHTDMAAKLQSKAFDNSVLIGNNIVEALDLSRDIISNYYNKEGNREEVFQITPNLTYKFYVFEWKKYLDQHPNFKFIAKDIIKYEKKNIHLKCKYTFEGKSFDYFPNSKGIVKGAEIHFTLYENNSPYIKKSFEQIKWTIYNTGSEAKNDNCVSQEVDDKSKNLNTCNTTAKYLGLHKIQCKLIRSNSDNINIEFPVIVF